MVGSITDSANTLLLLFGWVGLGCDSTLSVWLGNGLGYVATSSRRAHTSTLFTLPNVTTHQQSTSADTHSFAAQQRRYISQSQQDTHSADIALVAGHLQRRQRAQQLSSTNLTLPHTCNLPQPRTLTAQTCSTAAELSSSALTPSPGTPKHAYKKFRANIRRADFVAATRELFVAQS